jgi:hypothetical protein
MRLADEAAYFALEPGKEGELEAWAVTWPLAYGVADPMGDWQRVDRSQSIYIYIHIHKHMSKSVSLVL